MPPPARVRAPSPDEGIRAFQSRNNNHLGQPLGADGILGPETLWALQLATAHADRQAIVARALAKVGTRENPPGSNRGREIDEWVTRCRAPLGSPWCAASASHSLAYSRAIAGAILLLESFPETPVTHVCPGDVYAYRTDMHGHGHIGILLGSDLGRVMGVEGNVDSEQRVVSRLSAGLRFGRTCSDTTGVCPGVIESVPHHRTEAAGTR